MKKGCQTEGKVSGSSGLCFQTKDKRVVWLFPVANGVHRVECHLVVGRGSSSGGKMKVIWGLPVKQSGGGRG